MTISSQKLYSVLRKAGYQTAKYRPSKTVRGWGAWSSGVEVIRNRYLDRWQVEYNFGDRGRDSTDPMRRVAQLQGIQRALRAAGIECYPNEHETALIIGPADD